MADTKQVENVTEASNKGERNAKIMLITSMVIFGTIGIFRRYIPLGSASLAMVRGFIGMLSMLVVLAVKRTKIDWKSVKKNLVILILSGGFIGINWILLFEAYNYTTIAVATLCYYMAPIFVMILSPFVLKEKLGGKKIICVIIALIGMVFVSGILNGDGIGNDFRGVLFGLGAAVFYATVILMNQKLKDIGAYDKTIFQLGSAAIVILPYVLITEKLDTSTLNAFAILMIVVVGIVHTGVAYALYFGSMNKAPAQTVALFGYIDPIVAILLSALFLAEKMGVYEIIGTVCVLSATIVSEIDFSKKSK